ncbi:MULTISPECIES: hypothetical protein [unclassified Streptomyces]|uniref:Uncharacterized protein n=1 Tax=Streptomyces doebereineriae TaxID=3075528 RepID=A0ABU2VP59_9ACTN|nr:MULTISPECIES: hypothetical protein [unclassified Streptomyces]KQW15535.1 hypothetical protein ASD08_27115 [Streptomyces sp. Root369]MDT0486939.1 hypothetical protein [Streptomyces sp. DSM 41640]
MFNRRKIATLSVLAGGLLMTCVGIAQAHVAAGPGNCTRDLFGFICTQRITGVIPEDGVIPHQETCAQVKPATSPAALGNGRARLGPEVTCAAPASTAPDATDTAPEETGLLGLLG